MSTRRSGFALLSDVHAHFRFLSPTPARLQSTHVSNILKYPANDLSSRWRFYYRLSNATSPSDRLRSMISFKERLLTFPFPFRPRIASGYSIEKTHRDLFRRFSSIFPFNYHGSVFPPRPAIEIAFLARQRCLSGYAEGLGIDLFSLGSRVRFRPGPIEPRTKRHGASSGGNLISQHCLPVERITRAR